MGLQHATPGEQRKAARAHFKRLAQAGIVETMIFCAEIAHERHGPTILLRYEAASQRVLTYRVIR